MAGATTGVAAGGAAGVAADAFEVRRSWIRTTRPGQQNAAAYFEIRNPTRVGDRLVAVRVAPEIAARAELHTMRLDGDLMIMRQVDTLPLPAAGSLRLAPGGNHLMLMELRAPLATGAGVDLVLVFEKAGELRLRVAVQPSPPTASPPPAAGRERRP